MACEACEHCQRPLSRHEAVVRNGYSYHSHCHKCYVCSETNLRNAEVFKGVIFCSSCSQRIFQGCSTARRTKTTRQKRSLSRSRHTKRERSVAPSPRSRPKVLNEGGIIELARLGRSTGSESCSDHYEPKRTESKLVVSTELSPRVGKECPETSTSIEMKKRSAEIGMTTEFTQQLLKEMNCPIVEWKIALPCTANLNNVALPEKPQKKEQTEEKFKKAVWSDLRVAELGASTEIANMALRKQSMDTEVHPNRRLEVPLKLKESTSLSVLTPGLSSSGVEDWLDTNCQSPTRSRSKRHLLEKPIGDIMRMPYRYFKTRILRRSSLVSVLVSNNEQYSSLLQKIKSVFHEEIAEHHRRGIRRLYSTIHRRQTPYRLGWLRLEPPGIENRVSKSSSKNRSNRKCKHFRISHSYRCLRSQVMRLAGPTKSELAMYRAKIKQLLSFKFLKYIFNYLFMILHIKKQPICPLSTRYISRSCRA